MGVDISSCLQAQPGMPQVDPISVNSRESQEILSHLPSGNLLHSYGSHGPVDIVSSFSH